MQATAADRMAAVAAMNREHDVAVMTEGCGYGFRMAYGCKSPTATIVTLAYRAPERIFCTRGSHCEWALALPRPQGRSNVVILAEGECDCPVAMYTLLAVSVKWSESILHVPGDELKDSLPLVFGFEL